MQNLEFILDEIEAAIYDLFGPIQSLHVNDLDEILAGYDISDPTGESENGLLNSLPNAKAILKMLIISETEISLEN